MDSISTGKTGGENLKIFILNVGRFLDPPGVEVTEVQDRPGGTPEQEDFFLGVSESSITQKDGGSAGLVSRMDKSDPEEAAILVAYFMWNKLFKNC